jgi:hypothetical protein
MSEYKFSMWYRMSYVRWVPCHHGMALPQVAVGEEGLQIMEGSCEYIE